MSFISCENPVIEKGFIVAQPETVEEIVIDKPETEEVAIEPEIVEPEIVIDEPIIIIEIEIIEQEKEMELKPITVYEKYAVSESMKVFGLNGKELELINLEDVEGNLHPFTDFFVDNGTLYFQVKETAVNNSDPKNPTSEEVIHYFSQIDSEIAEFVTAKDYPKKPLSSFVTMKDNPFEIIKFDYNGMDTSRVIQTFYNEDGSFDKNSPTAYKMIDGFCFTESGLWFSVPEDLSIRLKGLYFYPVDGNIQRVSESGRIW